MSELQPTGPVIGIMPDAVFSTREITLEKNDLVLAYTDGIPDARNVENDFFGSERLLELLGRGVTTPAALLKDIEERLRQFIGTADQFDDITLLAVKRDP